VTTKANSARGKVPGATKAGLVALSGRRRPHGFFNLRVVIGPTVTGLATRCRLPFVNSKLILRRRFATILAKRQHAPALKSRDNRFFLKTSLAKQAARR
jgi:hypothetical protein